jgi:hypothetical protein
LLFYINWTVARNGIAIAFGFVVVVNDTGYRLATRQETHEPGRKAEASPPSSGLVRTAV